MFSEDGKFILSLLLLVGGIFASGYFFGWGRNKLATKIFDKMMDYLGKARYWEHRYDDVAEQYADLFEVHLELKHYTVEQVGKEHVPEKWGGEA